MPTALRDRPVPPASAADFRTSPHPAPLLALAVGR